MLQRAAVGRGQCGAKGRGQELGVRRQALVSEAPYFRLSALVPSVLWFLPKASFDVSFC